MASSLLIRNGSVHDGLGSAPVAADVRIRDGVITEIGRDLLLRDETVFDAPGLIVCPGLIDLHVHVYSGMGQFSIDPDRAGLRTGVTTMLDTGTAGSLTYEPFHRFVMPNAAEEIYALLNISMIGCLQGNPSLPPYMGELSDIRHADVPSAVACIRKYRDRLLGTKVRLTTGLASERLENERAGLQGAVEAAKQTGTFCMVHHAKSKISVTELYNALRPGDVVTHLYHPHADTPFTGKDGAPCDALRRARDRGIKFDVGHGMGAFGWRIAEPGCQKHAFWPDTISTDLHAFNTESPVVDLPTTMTKFLHLGMPLPQLIRAVTSTSADILGLGGRLGRIGKGHQGDVTILQLGTGKWDLMDVEGQTRTTNQRLRVVATIKRGALIKA